MLLGVELDARADGIALNHSGLVFSLSSVSLRRYKLANAAGSGQQKVIIEWLIGCKVVRQILTPCYQYSRMKGTLWIGCYILLLRYALT